MADEQSDLGFQTFFGTILLFIMLPLGYNLVKLTFFYEEEYKNTDNKKEYVNCECNACKNRLKTHNKKVFKKNFSKGYYIKLVVFCMMAYWVYKSFSEISDNSDKINFKGFDPYDILGVKYNDSIANIKRAYRKLMTTQHPDRLISQGTSVKEAASIRMEFIRIVTAYEILTDPEKKQNFEKYGDPDGPKSGLHYVLPSFFFSKKYHFPILVGFLLFIFGLAIFTLFYLRGSEEYDEQGNSKTNQAIYYYNLNEHVLLKHIPFIMGLSIEFNNFPVRLQDEKKLSELWMMCKDFVPKIKGNGIPLPNKKVITLIYAWLSRIDDLDNALKLDQEKIQEIILDVFPKMYFFANTINKAKAYNKKIKTLGYNCIKSLAEFSQCINQRLWFDYSPYLQLPYLQDSVLNNKKLKKELVSFREFLESNELKKKEILTRLDTNLNENQIKEILDVSNVLPRYDLNIKVYVDGLEDILVKDLVTFELDVVRKINDSDNLKIGFCHSSYLNGEVKESISILFCDNEDKLLEDSLVKIQSKSTIVKFQFRPMEVR